MLLLISEAAKQSNCTPPTLRKYEKLGLISPLRDSGGRRLYTDKDVLAARSIRESRALKRGAGVASTMEQMG